MMNPYSQKYNENLLKRFKKKRSELINLATKSGFDGNNVIACSQELDLLIYEIVKYNMQAKGNELIELREMDGIH